MGCTGLRLLPAGAILYTGAKVTLQKKGTIEDRADQQAAVNGVLMPHPNETFLHFWRPRLWFYEIAGTPKKKGLRYMLKKLGEPPVLFSSVTPMITASLVRNRLSNMGYFHAQVSYRTFQKRKTVFLRYSALLFSPYHIHRITFPQGGEVLDSLIRASKPYTLLDSGQLFNLDRLKMERERIDQYLKDEGYFYFSPEYLVFHVDSSLRNGELNLTLVVKEETPEKARKRYFIGTMLINPSFSLERDTLAKAADTLRLGKIYYLRNDSSLHPSVVIGSIFFHYGEYYSAKNHDMTLRHLMGIGIFKYVNIRFIEVNAGDSDFLQVVIQLTRLPKNSVSAEFLGIAKSNNFSGPALDISYRNRNLFKGSELLTLSEQFGFEAQLSGRIPGQPVGSLSISTGAGLSFPRFITPFHIKPSSFFVPKTNLEAAYARTFHFEFFTLDNLQIKAGYSWKETPTKLHELNPLFINYINVRNTGPRFDSLIRENILLKNNFEKQFIIGSQYSYTYNTGWISPPPRTLFYFKGGAEFAGNLLNTINSLLLGHGVDPEHPRQILGLPYSQYTRFETDTRFSVSGVHHNKLATRLLTGVGFPYGNAVALPYVKQFFIGGTNSIRAFRSHSLGPGSTPPPSADSLRYFEQAGDIKLELNAEYRFNIWHMFKGAVFTDAGNIWLLHPDPLRPGGVFTAAFLKQVAVGTGIGLRLDASFLVVRLDLAFPLRKPWLADGDRWVIQQIRFGSPGWRSDNLILNIAVGYPF